MTKETEIKSTNDVEMEKKFPSSVDFMLLGTCNLKCNFCFGPNHEIPAMRTDFAVDVIDKLSRNGVESIVFTGGEPTLIKDLPVILSAAKNRNLATVLSTNGLTLASKEELLDEIAPHLDWIALPLEADTPEVNADMRVGFTPDAGIKHFDAVLGLIPRIRERYPDLKIKLGTVVAQPNSDHVAGIPDLLVSRGATPDTWKLYQVSPSEYGKLNYSNLEISDEEFERVYEEARARAIEAGIPNVQKYTNRERPGKYLFINPRGDALTVHPDTNDYFLIGNVLTGFNEVANKLRSHININALTTNFGRTYPQN